MSDTELPDDPQVLRRDIAATRADMGRTLEELEDRVSPTKIKERQTERVRSRWESVRSSVMGSADEAREHGSDVQDAMQQAPDRLESATRGNPLAAGLIAFGLGALAGSLLPASDPERKAAGQLRDRFEEPVKESMRDSGEQMKAELQGQAQHAVEETKQTAQQATERVQSQAQDSAGHLQEHAQGSAQTVRDQR